MNVERPTPSTDILNRIAKVLEASPDFLMNGTLQNKSTDAISDEDFLLQFRKVEQLPTNKKKLIKEFLDAFLFKMIYKNNCRGKKL